ncbi:hypothetical protein J5J83_13470 [Azoarcus sp. L1K30]|uniref:hypothetical protein n=1 Tax=Azoarcus sp. L1K30 TaxID=2820277 RepID=UPI001B8125AC|nr:hypothetical protein [Azoarcus sp. L1K30]MBR0567127.1 hypothetical protein [Azoarcus sp. L1K30]
MRAIRKLAIVVAVLLVTMCSWLKPVTELATASVDAGLKRAVISFATARALNGAISVLQGTELAVQPVGVGVSLSVGEILDPINDLVESLSSVMLTASVAFGIQKLLLVMGSNWTVSAFVTGVALLWVILYMGRGAPGWLTRLMLVLIFARFVMPLTLIGSSYVFEQFSAGEYQQSQVALDRTSSALQRVADAGAREDTESTPPAEVPAPAAEPQTKQSGWFDWARDMKSSAQDTLERALSSLEDPVGKLTQKFEALKAAAEDVAERMIRLIVIFLMQTLIVPVLLLWGLYRLTAGLAASGARERT